MKKLLVVIIVIVVVLVNNVFAQQWQLNNQWNVPTATNYNSILDSKPNPGDGIYTIEKNVVLVPYVQNGDTLYGTMDSCTFLKKFTFQGTLVWNVSFPTVMTFDGTVGEPGKIKILADGILLLCNWGIAKYNFDGTQLFSTVYPESSFDQSGFFGGSNGPDFFWNDILENNGATITLGHISQCDTICHTGEYTLRWVNQSGTIVDSMSIDRSTEMCFVQQNGFMYFAYLQGGAIMVEKVDLETKAVSLVSNCLYEPFGLWDINKLISLHKTTNGFRLVTSNVKDWDVEYNTTHTPTNYFVEIDAIANTMMADIYVQNNTKLKVCMDELTSALQIGDTLYVSTEDAKIIKWDNSHQITVVDVLGPQEKIYGTARIALFGDKLLYVTNDSILTTTDSIVGNVTYYTEYKSVVIRVLDRNMNVLVQDTLDDYSQFDLNVIDSTSFTFSGWWYTHPSLLSSWSLINNGTVKIGEQSASNKFEFGIYPSPTADYITISGVEEGILIVIMDLSGRIVFEGEYQNQIDVRSFAPGVYCLRIEEITKKFIVQ
ncbi:MAG: T9SS type A sorting domain-containing protein [bacterium]